MSLFKSILTLLRVNVVISLFIAVPAANAVADQLVATAGGGPAKGTVGRTAVAAAGPTGTWFRNASASDSNAVPAFVQAPAPRLGPYPVPIAAGGGVATAADTGLISNPGIFFNPTARGCLSYGPGFYDTGCTTAAVPRIAFGGPETAKAVGVAVDPSEYTVQFDLNFPTQVEFTLTFSPGMNLLALSDEPFTTSYASITGFDETDLLSGLLWSFAWSADSANPNSSVFVFESHPTLGLDDAAIMLEFLSNVTSSNGEHVLGAPVVVTGIVDVELEEGEDTLVYTFGGETTAIAGAVARIPEPTSWALCVLGLASIAAFSTHRKRP